MKFAFVIFKYFPYGGIQRDMMKLVDECKARGHEVKIFTLRWEADMDPDLDVEVMPIVGLHRHSQYDHFAEDVRAATRDAGFDLVLGFNKMPGLDVYYAGDSCYLQKALTQRDAWYRLLPRFKSFARAERAVFDQHSSTHILTLSSSEVPSYRHHYRTQAERFHPLPPGIERDRIAPDDVADIRRELRAEFGLAEDALVLLFIGSGFIKKGLDRALLAIQQLPEDLLDRVHLFVIGRDKSERFERMALRLGIAEKVTFFSRGRDDVPRFLFAADGLVHPAYDETAGMIIVEAILARLPALITRNCGYAPYLEQYDAGIIHPREFDQELLNRQLVELLTSEQRAQWQTNGRRAATDEGLFGLVPKAVDYLEGFTTERKPVLAFALYRYFPFGGLQRDFMKIALASQAAGYDILVYCLSWEAEIPEGFQVIVYEVERLANHRRYERFARLYQEDVRWRKVEAVIGFNKLPGLDIYYAADPCFEHKAQAMRNGLYRRTDRYRLLAEFEREVFAGTSATRVMLIAPEQKAQFQQYYETSDARLTMMPPGLSRDRMRGEDWRVQRQRVREDLGIGDDEHLLVLIGSGFITKGLDRALRCFAALPGELLRSSRFLVVGQDNPSAFWRLARTLEIEDRVIIQRGRDDIPDLLQGADLMVHPAYMESGGMVLIEAVVAGLPVVTTSVCGFARFVREADAGTVIEEPFAQQRLNEAVAQARRDDQLRARWSANGIAFGQQRDDLFDMPNQAVAFIEDTIDAA
ncbi:MAG: glycosyltransferase family 4 protein [Pseudomonadota bacterium]